MAVRDFSEFMDFGLGIDDLNGNIRGQAVTSGPPQPIPGNIGQKSTFQFHLTESVEDLHTSLGLSVDANAQYGLFGGSDKFNFAQSCNFHSYSVFLLMNIQIQNPSTHILGEKLVTEGSTLLGNNDTARFRAEFGDLYVKGIELGGEYFAVVEIKTTNQTDQTTISDSISASGFLGVGEADLAATFSSTFEKSVQGHDHRVSSFQVGGAGSGQKFNIEVAEIINKALGFAQEVLDAPVPYRVELQDYLSLPLPKPPNSADLQLGKDVMRSLAGQRAICLAFLNDAAYIQDPANTDQFEDFDNVAFTAAVKQANDAVNEIGKAASTCLNDIHSCALITPTIPTTDQLPKRKTGAAGPPPAGPPPLDSITTFALQFEYPNLLLQMKADLPHSTPQVQSDAALGIAENVAVSQATLDASPVGLKSSPVAFFVNIADTNSPIQRRFAAKVNQLTPAEVVAFGIANLPDLTAAQVNAGGLSTSVSQGMALRQAMQELGEDVSKITFN
jgi:hypothetical protein